LIVDDELDELDFTLTVKTVLYDNGFKVDSFNHPIGIEKFQAGLFDL
jgi:hypothetical protein